MKKRLVIFGICASACMVASCGGEDNSRCIKDMDCGDTTIYRCDVLKQECVERVPAHCLNKSKDSDETDIDCGGSCGKCAIGKACSVSKDCDSGNCNSETKRCEAVSCESNADCEALDEGRCDSEAKVCFSCANGTRDGNESDVDCGGACAAKCENGKQCRSAADCLNEICDNGVCAGASAAAASVNDIFINEVMSDPDKKVTFGFAKTGAQCDFVEIVNKKAEAQDLTGVTLHVLRTDDGKGKQTDIPLEGRIHGKSAYVVVDSECGDVSDVFPERVGYKQYEKGNMFTKDGKYEIWFSAGEAESDKVTYELSKGGVSANRNPDRDSASPFALHTDVNPDVKNSPGYCANGGSFENDCQVATHCSNGSKDEDETDVDCGGSCGACAKGKVCKVESDCKSFECTDGKCTGEDAEPAALGDLFVNEALSDPDKNKTFETATVGKQCDFVEIVNLSDQKKLLTGVTLRFLRTDDGKNKETTIPLTGYINGKSAYVVLEKECYVEQVFPSDVEYLETQSENLFTKGAKYDIWFTLDGVDSEKVSYFDSGRSTSSNRKPDGDVKASFASHADVNSELKHSPGYCANGGLFSAGCKADVSAAPCTNGVKDGDETDVDCGGSCGACENGKTCAENSDCQSGDCTSGKCAQTERFDLSKNELVINEVMGSPKTGENFAIQTETPQCEFVEIINMTEKTASLSGVKLQFRKTSETTDKTVDLTSVGKLDAHGAVVVSGCDIPVPKGVVCSQTLGQKVITNNSDYEFTLTDGTHTTPAVKRVKLSSANGKSQNRSPDRSATNTALVFHDTLNDGALLNSPGYCANGGLFIEDCVVTNGK